MLIEDARRLRKRGYSYQEIANRINRSKKFAYSKTKDVSFDAKGELRYNREVKGILKRVKVQTSHLNLEKTRIIGHLLFDGCLCNSGHHYYVRYISSSKNLIDQFALDMESVYGLYPSSLERSPGKNVPFCYKITFKSKSAFNDLQGYFVSYSTSNKNTFIPKEIMAARTDIKLEFLRTFFEDEGSISHKGRIMGDLKNEKIIKQLIILLKEVNLIFKICSYEKGNCKMWKIYLPKTHENLMIFHSLKLFDKAKITLGYNVGKKKIDVLRRHLLKK